MARGKGRPFQRGISGNPSGRPPGAKNALSGVRDLVNEVHDENREAIKTALARVPTSPRTALQFQDLRARLNKEIGQGSAEVMSRPRVTINFISNVRPEKLAAARIRALPLPPANPENSSVENGV